MRQLITCILSLCLWGTAAAAPGFSSASLGGGETTHFKAEEVISFAKKVAQKYFVAQPVEVNPSKLMLGSVFSAEVATTDHPSKPVTATFERISDYLLKYDQGTEVLTVKP